MPRPASDIPERLLEAARRHFLAQGVDGSSLRAIAKEAGTSIGMIYYHYETKDELFRAVVEQFYEPLLADLTRTLDPSLEVAERVRRVFARFGAMSDEEMEVVRIIIQEGMSHSERLRWVIDRFRRGHLPMVFQLVVDGVADGTFRADQHPLVLLVATGSLGLFSQVIRRRLPDGGLPVVDAPGGEELAEAMAEVLLRGLAPSSDEE